MELLEVRYLGGPLDGGSAEISTEAHKIMVYDIFSLPTFTARCVHTYLAEAWLNIYNDKGQMVVEMRHQSARLRDGGSKKRKGEKND